MFTAHYPQLREQSEKPAGGHCENVTGKGCGLLQELALSALSDANIVLARGVGMDYERDKVDEMVLALLPLTISEEDTREACAWKSHD